MCNIDDNINTCDRNLDDNIDIFWKNDICVVCDTRITESCTYGGIMLCGHAYHARCMGWSPEPWTTPVVKCPVCPPIRKRVIPVHHYALKTGDVRGLARRTEYDMGVCTGCKTITEDRPYRTMYCGHTYHTECMDTWYSSDLKCCPLCVKVPGRRRH